MAGVKGRSGGARPGSGPKKKSEAQLVAELVALDAEIAKRGGDRAKPKQITQASVREIQADVAKDMKTVPETSVDRPLSAEERKALLEERRAALGEIFPAGPADPLEFLQMVQQNVLLHADLRVKSAMKLAEFKHAKPGDKGVKETKQDKANQLGTTSRFAPPAPPKLVSNN